MKKVHLLQPLIEEVDAFFRTPDTLTQQAPFVRDVISLKRVMVIVVIALMPCLFMGMYNVGYQVLAFQRLPTTFSGCMGIGAGVVLPIILVTYLVGGFWEVLFSVVRRHRISEGFFVTGMLFALAMPPSIKLWQVAMGISFGVIFGKEIFGGTGRNIFNPALTGRAFMFFSYPIQFSGSDAYAAIDGFTQATPLSILNDAGYGSNAVATLQAAGYTLPKAFIGLIPGSIGETSTLACLLGLVLLLVTRIASWRTITACFLGLITTSLLLFGLSGPERMTYFTLPPYWHLVIGSFAYGSIFMATDPVSSAATNTGRWIYGFMIGFMIVLIRVFNPAFTDGVLLSILFMNAFAPLIDHFVVQSHIKRRTKRRRLRAAAE